MICVKAGIVGEGLLYINEHLSIDLYYIELTLTK